MTQSKTIHTAVRALCEGAIMVALATILSLFRLFQLPQGGSVNLGMLPIFIYCCRWGWKQSVLTALAYGLLQIVVDGASGWGLVCILLDYILAFTVLSTASLFNRMKGGIYIGVTVACVLRFVCHFISGVTAFRILAPTELFNTTFTNPYIYAAAYNGSFLAIDLALCLVILALLRVPLKKQLTVQG